MGSTVLLIIPQIAYEEFTCKFHVNWIVNDKFKSITWMSFCFIIRQVQRFRGKKICVYGLITLLRNGHMSEINLFNQSICSCTRIKLIKWNQQNRRNKCHLFVQHNKIYNSPDHNRDASSRKESQAVYQAKSCCPIHEVAELLDPANLFMLTNIAYKEYTSPLTFPNKMVLYHHS